MTHSAAPEAEVAAAPARPVVPDGPRTRRFPFRVHGPQAGTPSGQTSRRRMLWTGAKVAAATVAAGVLIEQVGTRTAYAAPASFSSNVPGTPAVSATGINGADGADASSDSGTGVSASSGTGTAVSASSLGGTAVYASSNSGTGVAASSAFGIAVSASGNTYGVNASGLSGPGVAAASTSGPGVTASSQISIGVAGYSIDQDGVFGSTKSYTAYGVHGVNTTNSSGTIAVLGHSDDGSGGLGRGIGVQGETAGGIGVTGTATTGTGTQGLSNSGDGVFGATASAAAFGIHGSNTSNAGSSIAILGHSDNGNFALGPGIGVKGETAGGYGLYGSATTGVGVYGTSAGGGAKQAIQGVGSSGAAGLRATSDSGNGIVAASTSGTGLNVQSSTGSAVIATSNGVGYGLYLTAPSGWAIGCAGRVRVLGNAVGTATLAGGTTSKTVATNACDGSSQVILTATANPQVFIWATVAPGAFTIHASAAPTSNVTFSYLLIN